MGVWNLLCQIPRDLRQDAVDSDEHLLIFFQGKAE